jgi:hypothetical protein
VLVRTRIEDGRGAQETQQHHREDSHVGHRGTVAGDGPRELALEGTEVQRRVMSLSSDCGLFDHTAELVDAAPLGRSAPESAARAHARTPATSTCSSWAAKFATLEKMLTDPLILPYPPVHIDTTSPRLLGTRFPDRRGSQQAHRPAPFVGVCAHWPAAPAPSTPHPDHVKRK